MGPYCVDTCRAVYLDAPNVTGASPSVVNGVPLTERSTMPQYCFHFINGNPLIDAVIDWKGANKDQISPDLVSAFLTGRCVTSI